MAVNDDYELLIKDSKINKAFLDEISKHAKANQLLGFEMARAILL